MDETNQVVLEERIVTCGICGAQIQESSEFCGSCGAKVERAASAASAVSDGGTVCPACGAQASPGAAFCPSCGERLTPERQSSGQNRENDLAATASTAIKTIVTKASNLTGGDGNVDLRLKDLVTNVFKKHTKKEQDEIFICGTSTTTPPPSAISSSWPKPWLYSRVLLMFSVVFALLYVMAQIFQNTNAVPGLIFIGALAVPFSILVFFFEVNAPRNISIFETVKLFFVGGAFSLVVTLILFSIVPVGDLNYIGAVLVGIIEELGKLIVVAYFCRKAEVKYILNGLLIGAAIGAGFAVFETAGYILNYLLNGGWDMMMSTLIIRAVFALGGHVVWAAIEGAALVTVKQDQELDKKMLVDPKFLRVFAVPVVLHAIWDMPIPQIGDIPITLIILTVAAWLLILIFVNNGLKQISDLRDKASDQADPVS